MSEPDVEDTRGAMPAPWSERGRPGTVFIAVLVLAALIVVPVAFAWSQLNRPAEVTGTVIAIRAKPPLGVDTFDLLAQDGRRLTFRVGQLDVSPGGFDAPHLLTHQATGQAVVVGYRTEGSELVAVRLTDGPAIEPPAAPSPTS